MVRFVEMSYVGEGKTVVDFIKGAFAAKEP